MSSAIAVFTIIIIINSSIFENANAQIRNPPDSGTVFKSLETLIEAVENLRTEIKKQETSLKNLEAKAELHDNSLNNLQTTVDQLKTLLITSNVKEEEQIASLNELAIQSDTQTTTLIKVETGLQNQTTVLNNLLNNEKKQYLKLTNLAANVTTLGDKMETLTDQISNLRANKDIVEGIIAATASGVVIIPLDSREQRQISSEDTMGVAFNWKSRNVFWIESKFGIKTANLDGSSAHLIIADTSDLCGLAVDQITGNFYYGVRGLSPRIQVCDSKGKKCLTISSGVSNVGKYIRDIALFPSEGLMFWSSPYDKKVVFRANMDGTNATVIISENIYGLYADQFTQRLYWTNFYGKIIGNHDFNGNNRDVLLNATTTYPYDVAVDGDTVYLGGSSPNGVYSVTQDGIVSSMANTTDYVDHIALYGRNKVYSRPNPCKSIVCTNLCVLTLDSYTCL